MEAEAAHEASVGKLSSEALYYLMSRGLSEEKARSLVVKGFTSEISKELPVEYAMEMNNLIKMEMEGTA
jgi:Fe-S cluster assembly protein SufB